MTQAKAKPITSVSHAESDEIPERHLKVFGGNPTHAYQGVLLIGLIG